VCIEVECWSDDVVTSLSASLTVFFILTILVQTLADSGHHFLNYEKRQIYIKTNCGYVMSTILKFGSSNKRLLLMKKVNQLKIDLWIAQSWFEKHDL
jgi:hypothetical protein